MIIFMGVAGAGKSMQGRLLADQAALPWVSTGEFLRMLVSGQQRKDMLAGKLLDDKQIISLVQKIFSVVDTKHEFILDGFPRTVGQADWLINQFKHGQLAISAVVNLVASKDVVRKRLLGRGRQDDNEQSIVERFGEYQGTILPVLEQFKLAGIPIHKINGDQDTDVVHKDIISALKDVI